MKKFLGIALMILMLVFTLASCDMVKGMIIKHEVTFSLDGGVAGEGYTESVEIGDGKTLTLSTPTREGYNFLGWYSGETKVTESTPITSDMTLTAKWEIKTFKVSFLDYYGNTVSNQTVNYGESATAPTVDSVIEKKRFDGWSADFSKVTEDMTVNALYVDNTYTITYNLGDKGESINEPCFFGDIPKIPAAPVIDGYVFTGWYLDAELTDRYFFDYKLERDITLYAKFYDTSLGEYIVISNLEQFKAIKDQPGAKYLLACDINCHGEQLTPITTFSGELEGNGFKIYNFIISETSKQAGIINNNTGIIKNLYVGDYTYNVNATLGSESSFGIIVAKNYGTVDNCHVLEGEINVSASITNEVPIMIGGVIGYNAKSGGTYGIISNCTNRATINTNINFSRGTGGNIDVGGIAGRNSSECFNSTNHGTINAHNVTGNDRVKSYFVGGVVGWNYAESVMKNCANLGEVNHTIELIGILGQPCTYTGGLAGANDGNIYDCYTTGNVTKIEIDNYDYKYETIDYVGGFTGRNLGIIHNSYSTGYVKTMSSLTLYVGSFVGNNDIASGYQSIIKKCFATGAIEIYDDIETPTEDVKVGYFAGMNNVTVNDCYYIDSITLTYKTLVDNVETEKEIEPNCASGTAISEDELFKADFIENSLYFDRTIWFVIEGQLPTLR